MKNIFLVLISLLSSFACDPNVIDPNDPDPMVNTTLPIPELGVYNSFDTNIVPDSYKYNYKSNQWEWRFGDVKLELTPSVFGRLRFNKNGSYEFLDINESGTYKLDNTSKKLVFTGYMAGADGYFYIKRGWCTLVIATKAKDGTVLSIRYEKKSDFPQPEVQDPNGSFTGTIVNMLSKNSTDYLDVASGKTIKTHSTLSAPITGNSNFSVSIYKKNIFNDDEIYPVIEIKDQDGNLIKKFEKTWQDVDRWDIGDYWYGMISPDGSKLALIGKYKRYISFLDPRSANQYPMVGIIDLKTEKEIFSYPLDYADSKWAPGWSPNGELVLPRKGGGINILDASLKNIKSIYTKNVNEARMNQFGKVLFHEGIGLYTIDSNGSNLMPVSNGKDNLTIAKLFDLCWSPDGKSMAFVVEQYLQAYNIILLNPGSNAIYFSDSKGDEFQFSGRFVNWK